MTMAACKDTEVVTDVYPFFRIYKDGRVERFYDDARGSFYVPPSLDDPITGVSSKDVTISPFVSARLFLPKTTLAANQKLPVLVYYHGGGLVIESAFFKLFQSYLSQLASELNVVAVSVEYRLAPENDIQTLYQDCWTALQWVASHADRDSTTIINSEPWLTNHGDFERVFLAGDSAGGNIVFNMTMKAGGESLNSRATISGSILLCPYFLMPIDNLDKEGLPYKIWINICPPLDSGLSAIDSPMINPLAKNAPSLLGLGCSRLLVSIAGKDEYIPREVLYGFIEGVKSSGWKGELEHIEIEDECHSFQIFKPESEKANDLMKCIASFVQRM